MRSAARKAPRSLASGASLLAFAALVAMPGDLAAQIEPSGTLAVHFLFDFSNPGARSLGIAGAFVARADDATAAYANPAGLTVLKSPEVSVEGRHWEWDTTFGEAQRGGQVARFADVSNSVTGLSFLSIAYPVRNGTLAFYRHELTNFQIDSGQLTPTRWAPPEEEPGQFNRDVFFDAAGLDLQITGWGLSAGVEVAKDLSLGVTVVLYESELLAHSVTTVEGAAECIRPCLAGTKFAGGGSDEFGFNLGLLWSINRRWSIGAVHREGPEFEVERFFKNAEPGGPTPATRRGDLFKLPTVTGLGASWAASENLLASFETSLIRYSETIDDRDERVPGGRGSEGRFVVDDVLELRLGLEYTLWRYRTSPAFRIGVWHDPDHRVRFKVKDSTLPPLDQALLHTGGDDEVHISAGFGLVVGRFQLDVAADLSDLRDTYSLSAIFFF